jgi:hypothetical protein
MMMSVVVVVVVVVDHGTHPKKIDARLVFYDVSTCKKY